MQELVRVRQSRDESISDLMNRVRLLVLAAHRSVMYKEREKILIFHFIWRLYDNSSTLHTSTMSFTKAAEGIAVGNRQRFSPGGAVITTRRRKFSRPRAGRLRIGRSGIPGGRRRFRLRGR